MRFEDCQAVADAVDVFDRLEDGGRIEMVQEARAQNHVEAAVLGRVQMAHVVLIKLDVVEPQALLEESRLVQIRLANLDTDGLRAVEGKLDRIMALVARQIQNAKLVHGLSGEVGDGLHKAAHSPVGPGRLARVDTISKVDGRAENSVFIDEVL